MWVRGLKRGVPPTHEQKLLVAPYVGAWIETSDFTSNLNGITKSHPMWVRGLKLKYAITVVLGARRTLCGCVD